MPLRFVDAFVSDNLTMASAKISLSPLHRVDQGARKTQLDEESFRIIYRNKKILNHF